MPSGLRSSKGSEEFLWAAELGKGVLAPRQVRKKGGKSRIMRLSVVRGGTDRAVARHPYPEERRVKLDARFGTAVIRRYFRLRDYNRGGSN